MLVYTRKTTNTVCFFPPAISLFCGSFPSWFAYYFSYFVVFILFSFHHLMFAPALASFVAFFLSPFLFPFFYSFFFFLSHFLAGQLVSVHKRDTTLAIFFRIKFIDFQNFSPRFIFTWFSESLVLAPAFQTYQLSVKPYKFNFLINSEFFLFTREIRL